MTRTDYILIVGLVIITGLIIYFNSCNKQQIDTRGLDSLVSYHLRNSDSLNKIAIDSLIKIANRDSVHNVTINNIFNNASKEKKQVVTEQFNNKFVDDIKRFLDSVYNANR